MNVRQIEALVRQHKMRYQGEEKQLFETNERFYQGRFYNNHRERKLMRSTGGADGVPTAAVNLFYAVTDSLLTAILGRDISVVVNGADDESEKHQFAVGRMLANEFYRNRFRSVAQVALMDASLRRRGAFKVIPDAANKGARILEVRPQMLGYDPDARVVSNSGYWIQCVPLPWRQFRQNIETGVYARPRTGAKPENAPTWAFNSEARKHYCDIFGYAVVWELYDMFSGKAFHFHEASRTILFEGEFSSSPFGMFALNHNSVNLDGIAEVELIFDQQVAVNDFRSTMMRLAYSLVPRMMFDAGVIDENSLANALFSPVGSFVPVKRQGSKTRGAQDLKAAFFDSPKPAMGADMLNAMDTAMADAQLVSSLVTQRRGQSTNVRTAREMAYIDAAESSRLSSRMANLEIDGIIPVAERTLYFIKKYRQGPHRVKIGQNDWVELSGQDLLRFEGTYQIHQESPVKNNPAVIAEALGQMANLIVGSPSVNMREVLAMLFEGMGVPRGRALLSEEEEAKLMEAQAAAEQGGGPPVDPEAMVAAVDAQSGNDPAEGAADVEQAMQMAATL